MTETMKINLTKAILSLKIISIVAGALIACFVVYTNIDNRIDKIEGDYAVFKGIMEERTRNIQDDVSEIKACMQKLLENLELSKDGQSTAQAKDKGKT